MEASLNFTIGLSHGIQWPWPIAVYLFLAGISGGAMAIALLVNLFKGNYENTPLLKSASTHVAPGGSIVFWLTLPSLSPSGAFSSTTT